jgi:hypothetical protein
MGKPKKHRKLRVFVGSAAVVVDVAHPQGV